MNICIKALRKSVKYFGPTADAGPDGGQARDPPELLTPQPWNWCRKNRVSPEKTLSDRPAMLNTCICKTNTHNLHQARMIQTLIDANGLDVTSWSVRRTLYACPRYTSPTRKVFGHIQVPEIRQPLFFFTSHPFSILRFMQEFKSSPLLSVVKYDRVFFNLFLFLFLFLFLLFLFFFAHRVTPLHPCSLIPTKYLM